MLAQVSIRCSQSLAFHLTERSSRQRVSCLDESYLRLFDAPASHTGLQFRDRFLSVVHLRCFSLLVLHRNEALVVTWVMHTAQLFQVLLDFGFALGALHELLHRASTLH